MALVFDDNKEMCDCKGVPITDVESGEIICGDCGLVLSEKTEDLGREWRILTDKNDERNRTGPPMTLAMQDMGLATIIGQDNRDAGGKPLSMHMKTTVKRLRVWDARCQAKTTRDRNLNRAFGQLITLKDKLALSDAVVEKAAYIYRKAKTNGIVRGRSMPPLLASAVYAACRMTETPRTLDDVAEAIDVKRTRVGDCYRVLVKELELKIPVFDPIYCVSRITSTIGCPEKVDRFAMNIIKKVEENKFSAGKDPMGLAAAAIYIACQNFGMSISQREVAEASQVSTVTIRNVVKGVKKSLKTEMD